MLDIRQIKGRLGGYRRCHHLLGTGCFPGSEPGQDSYYSRRNAGKVQDMIGRTLVAFALVFSLAAPLAAQFPPGGVRFMLYNGCEPIEPLFRFSLGDRGEEIGLTDDRIRTMAMSRLRAARMVASPGSDPATQIIIPATQIIITVAVVDLAFAYYMNFYKMLDDPQSGDSALGRTYRIAPVVGTHGNDAGYIMQLLSESLDAFIGEYLRVNEVACS